jgi:hypothetical protein
VGDTNAVKREVEKETGYDLLFQMVTEQRDAAKLPGVPVPEGSLHRS